MHTAHIINHFSQSFLNLFQCWFNTPCGRERSLSNLTTSTKAVGWQREVCPTSTKAVGWQREVCPTSTTSTKAVWVTERSLSNFNNFHKSCLGDREKSVQLQQLPQKLFGRQREVCPTSTTSTKADGTNICNPPSAEAHNDTLCSLFILLQLWHAPRWQWSPQQQLPNNGSRKKGDEKNLSEVREKGWG